MQDKAKREEKLRAKQQRQQEQEVSELSFTPALSKLSVRMTAVHRAKLTAEERLTRLTSPGRDRRSPPPAVDVVRKFRASCVLTPVVTVLSAVTQDYSGLLSEMADSAGATDTEDSWWWTRGTGAFHYRG
jgi:hypothetical protein